MSKILKSIIVVFVLALTTQLVQAQNCTVNAGVTQDICAQETLTLNGSSGGLINVNPVWSQVSGPAVTITSPNSLITTVTGTSTLGGETFIFRLTATCDDGKVVSNDVTYNIYANTIADAGNDLGSFCVGDPLTLSANAVGGGETGKWTASPTNKGILFADSNDPNTAVTFKDNQYGSTTLTWTITGPDCSSSDGITITNIGGRTPVSAGNDKTLDECYTSTQSYKLFGTFTGNTGSGQSGLWATVDGPNLPSFNNAANRRATVSGLIEGVYTLRWTVSGPCVNGNDEVIITVPAPTQDVTEVDFSNLELVYCDARTETTLTGVVPEYTGETISWTQTEGPGGVTITTDDASSTTIAGLDGSSDYTFFYEITSPVSANCTNSDIIEISYTDAPTISVEGGTDFLTVNCGDNSTNVTYVATGGNNVQWSIIDAPTPAGLTNYAGASGGNVTINNLDESGTYVVRFRNQSGGAIGCSNVFDDVNLVVSQNPTASNAGTDQILACNVVTTDLAGNIPAVGVGIWSQVSGPNTAIIVDRYLNTSEVNSLTDGEYIFKWVISAGNGCDAKESTVSVFVSSAVPTTAVAGPNANEIICAGSEYYMQANALIEGAETGLWSVSPSAGIVFEDDTSPLTKVTGFSNNTGYTFTWTIAVNCDGTASADAIVLTTDNTVGAVSSSAGPDVCKISGTTTITLDGVDPDAGTGEWTKLSGPAATITNPALNTTTVTGMVDGHYEFEWTTTGGAGCATSTDQVLVSISADATTPVAGSEIEVCGTSVNLDGNAAVIGTGTWSQETGSAGVVIADPNDEKSVISNLEEGVYTFKWTISNEVCPSQSDIVRVVVGGLPSTGADAGGPHADVCGTSTTLAGNAITNGSGIWSLTGNAPNSPTIVDETDPLSAINGLITGAYTFRWTSYGSALCPVTSDDVTINVLEDAYAGDDQTLCDVTNTVLTGNEGSTGTWTQVDANPAVTLTVNNANTVTVTDMVINTTYEFKYAITTTTTCPTSEDNVIVQVDGFGDNPTAGGDQELCDVASISLAANTPVTGTGLWTKLSGPVAGSFFDDGLAVTTFDLPDYGIYVFQWEVTNGSCSFSDVVRVENAEPPSLSVAGSNQLNVCPPDVQLAANNPTVGLGNWTVSAQPSGSTNPVFSSLISHDALVTLVEPGTYILDWTITNGSVCAVEVSSVTITIANLAPTTALAGDDQELCAVTTATMAGNPIVTGTGAWSLVSGPNVPVITTPASETSTITSMITGDYVFRWTATSNATTPANPCISADDVSIKIYDYPTASSPTATLNYCQFDTFTLDGNAAVSGSGIWTQVSGPTTVVFADDSDEVTGITAVGVGTYVFKWTISNGNCIDSEANQTVNINALPATPAITGDDVVCMGATITNLTSTAGTIEWFSSDPAIATINSATGEVTPVSSGDTNITYKVTDGNLCFATSATFVVTVNGVTGGTVAADQFIVFEANVAAFTQSVASTGEGALTYKWQNSTTNASAGFADIGGATSATYDHGALSERTWFKRVTTSTVDGVGCTAESNVLDITIDFDADLEIVKTVDDATPYVGSNVVFTLTATNNGPSRATNVVVIDLLPNGYTYVSDVPSAGTYVDGTGTWTVGGLANGDTETLAITAKVLGSGTYANTATIIGDQPDPTPANDTDTNTPVPVAHSDLMIVKTVDNENPDVGDDIVFTLTVTNNGLSDATNVVVNDLLPAGYTYVSNTPSVGGYVSGTGVWTIGALANTAVETLNITATVKASGSYANTATVSGDQDDNVPGNNTSTKTPGVVPQSDLMVVKTVDDNTPNVGSDIVFTLTVTNNGPSDNTNVSITDLLPTGYSYVSNNPSVGGYVSGTGVWTIGAMVNGAAETLDITATVLATGNYTNTATVSGDEDDPTPANDTDTNTPVPVPQTDLMIVKAVDNATPDVETNVVFTLTITNNGLSDATNVVVNDLLPTGYTYVGDVPSVGTYVVGTGIWTVGGLANGVSETLAITAKVLASGTYANTATVSGDEDDPTPGNNTSTETPVPVPKADLAIVKSVDKGTPFVGYEVVFTLTITNNGPSAATNVNVADLLPNGYTYVSDNASVGTYTSGTGIWTIGGIADGDIETLDITATVLASGTYANIATVSGDEDDPNPGNDSSINTPIPVAHTDLAIVKSVDNATPNVGADVVFTLTVTNNGLSDATNVEVNDLLPAGYTYVSNIPSVGSYVSGTGVWSIGTMANGATATLDITATVLATGSYANTAIVSGDEDDEIPANDSSINTPVPVAQADLMIIKTVDNASPYVGADVEFTLTVTNNGLSGATNVAVADLLPNGYTYVSDNASVGSYTSGTGVWTIGAMANGVTETLDITATVLATGNYANTATVSGDEVDPDPTNDSSTNTPVPVAQSDLMIDKTVDNSTPNVSANIVFTLSVTNNGLSNATNVTVTDLLPDGYEYVSDNASVGSYVASTGIWAIGALANANIETLSITAKVLANGIYENTAIVTGNETDLVLDNNASTSTPVPVSQVDLAITNTVDNSTPNVSSNVIFTLLVTNNGPSDDTNVTVTDIIPDGYTYVSDNPSVGSYDDGSGLWTIGGLANGDIETLEITATVIATGTYTNPASITGDEFDTDMDNNNSTSTITPVAQVDLEIVNTVNNSTPDVGSNVVFTLNITNKGPSDDTNVTVTDLLPDGYTYISDNPSTGNYEASTGLWTIGALAIDGSETLEITASVNAIGTYANPATVTGDQEDTDLSNNISTSTITPTAQADLMIVKTADNSNPFIGFDMVFTLTITNNGPSIATNVSVADLLPDGYTYVSNSATAGSYTASTGNWLVGNMANGATENLEITVTVNETGNYENTASITADEVDPDMDNNTSSNTPVPEIFNKPPVAEDDFATVEYGGVLEGESILDNDYDPDGDEITLNTTPIVDVEYGDLFINSDGTYTYTPIYNYDGEDSFTYEICDDISGCATAVVYITIDPVVGVIVPEGFSPNGDGINDLFVIPGIEEYPTSSLTIFNRWGNKVSEYTSGYLNDWAGINQFGINVGGSELPEGTYFIILDLGDDSEVIRANVYLKR